MSDNLKRYRTIRNALDKLSISQPKGNFARHLNTLAALINGIVAGKSANLPNIADKNVDCTQKESKVKRYVRWLQNEKITIDMYFLPFLNHLINSLCHQTLVIAIDGSDIGRDCMCLMASVIFKKRALPIYWMIVKQKKGHLEEALHIDLIKEVKKIIPADYQVVVVGDGEFDGTDFQRTIESYHWKYVCRTASNVSLYESGEEFSFSTIGIDNIGSAQYFSLPNVHFTRKCYGPVHAILWWDKKYKEPIYIITNVHLVEEACHYYKMRFRIETMFSDQKSRGFNIHKSHLSDPQRLNQLLIAVCLAYIWIIYLGTFTIKNKLYPLIHRKSRCDLSLFQLGLRILEYLMNHSKTIPVHFCMLDFQNPFD